MSSLVQRIYDIVKGHDGDSVTSFYSQGITQSDIEKVAHARPEAVYIANNGCIYIDAVKIAYWKKQDGLVLSQEEEELFAKHY